MDESKKAAYDATIRAHKMKKRKESEMDATRSQMIKGIIATLLFIFISR